jgi:hypothetical protein
MLTATRPRYLSAPTRKSPRIEIVKEGATMNRAERRRLAKAAAKLPAQDYCAECGCVTQPGGYITGNWRMVTGRDSGRPTWLLFPEGADPECPHCGSTWENQDDETSERCRGCRCSWFEGEIVSAAPECRKVDA